jgi:hypothetical protein
MIETVEEFIQDLRDELADSDPALIQDAVADAREHIAHSLETVLEADPSTNVHDEVRTIISDFGTPEEIATAYREIERRIPVGATDDPQLRVGRGRFLSVYRDSLTWSTVLYMALSFVLGTGYLMWLLMGMAFSALFSVTLIGLPVVIAYVSSIRGIGLLEGRLIETLLRVRMPRRNYFHSGAQKPGDRIRAYARDRRTWRTLLYAVGLWPAGCLYIVLLVLALTVSGSLLVTPLIQEFLGQGVIVIGNDWVIIPRWAYVFSVLGSILSWTCFLHLARAIGKLHGKVAKLLLVDDVSSMT